MNDIKQLTRMLAELDDMLVSCMRCGMCQSVCPVFGESLREADVTRGKLAMLDGLAMNLITDARGVKERLDKCLLCGSCEASCPGGVKVTDIFIRARAILTEFIGLSPVKRAIFRGTLSHPKLFSKLLSMGSAMQDLVTRPANEYHGTSCAGWMEPVLGDRHIVPLAKKPFHRDVPEKHTAASDSHPVVAFFPGCVVNKVYPGVGHACMKVLDFHGVGVEMPKNQACCGIPALSSGDIKTFTKLMRQNVDLFEKSKWDVLVTPCATCTATIKKIWPVMAESETPDILKAVQKIADKTMDISEFLIDRMGVTSADPAGKTKQIITWHDPCHLKKSLGVAAQPRKIISALPRTAFKEMGDADYCCGNGGSFNLQHYETSKAIGNLKRNNIMDTKASVVATGCPACMMQLTDVLSRNNDAVQVRHIMELYADTLPE